MSDRVRVVSGVKPRSTSFSSPTVAVPGSKLDGPFNPTNQLPGHIAVPGASATESYVDVTFVNPKGYLESGNPDPIVEFEVELREGVAAPLYYRSFSSPVRCGPLKGGSTYTVRVRGITRLGSYTSWSTSSSVSALRDASAPSAVTGVTVTATFSTLIITWTDVPDDDVRAGLGQYDVQLANDAAFTTNVKTQRVKGTIFGWMGLDTGTTYYARVRAIDYSGNEGPWSAGASGVPGKIPVNSIGGANGAFDNLAVFNLAAVNAMFADASITNAKIVDLSVNKLQADSVLAKRVMIGGGLNGILQSENYVAGSAGWAIKGDGSAEFSNVTVRGTITTGAASYTGPRIELRAADLNFFRLYTGHPQETAFGFLRVDIWGTPSTTSLEMQPPLLSGGSFRPYLRLTGELPGNWVGRAELGSASSAYSSHLNIDPDRATFYIHDASTFEVGTGRIDALAPLFMNDRPIRLRNDPNHGMWWNQAVDGPEINGWIGVRIHLVRSALSWDFNEDGYARAPSGWTTFSSRRIKNNIEDLDTTTTLDRIKAMRPRKYMVEGSNQFGFVAEELYEVEPSVVVLDRKGQPSAVDYGRLSTLAIAGVRDLADDLKTVKQNARDDIKALRDDLKDVAADIKALKQRVTALEAAP